jgi:hypothetical protein
MKKLFTILFFFVSLTLQAHRYYVSSSDGNDDDEGTTEALAWATIAKVNGFTFAAGDTVSFKRGDIWREKLTVPRSGTAGNYMVYGCYGNSGNKPRIFGSNTTTWTAEGHTNIWKSDVTTFLDPWHVHETEYCEIFFISLTDVNLWGQEKSTYTADFANLTAEYDWTWNASTVYVWSTTDPDAAYTSVEIPQRDNCIYIGTHDYIKIDSLDMRFTGCAVEADEHSNGRIGFTLSYCKISHIGSSYHVTGSDLPGNGYGTSIMRSDEYFIHNDISECGRRNISSHLYADTYTTLTNWVFEYNYLHGGHHGTGVSPRLNIGTGDKIDGVIIRNNKFYEPPDIVPGNNKSNFCSLEATATGTEISNVEIYDNLFMNCTLWDIGLTGNIVNVDIYNNTFFKKNINTSSSTNQITISLEYKNIGSPSNVKIKNNIFYTTNPYTGHHYQQAVNFNYAAPSSCVSEMDYNLFYYSDVQISVITFEQTGTYYRTGGTGKKMYPDLYADLGWQEHSPTNYLLSPDFVSLIDVANLNLQVTSPAKYTGITTLSAIDYAGNAWHSPPSIGAYEYNGSPPILVTSIDISAAGSATTITVEGGTLQLYTNVEPDNATDTTKTWSLINGTGEGTITQTGVVTAISDGTVTAKALANDESGIFDTYLITISNQTPPPGEGLPTVLSSGFQSGWTAIWAIVGGEVTDDGGGTVSDRGICWGTSANPTMTGLHAHCGTDEGSFSYTITGLKGNTIYHARAFATNGEGTAYGADISMTTPRFSVTSNNAGKRITNGLGKFVMISR